MQSVLEIGSGLAHVYLGTLSKPEVTARHPDAVGFAHVQVRQLSNGLYAVASSIELEDARAATLVVHIHGGVVQAFLDFWQAELTYTVGS